MSRVRINLYNFISIHQHDPNSRREDKLTLHPRTIYKASSIYSGMQQATCKPNTAVRSRWCSQRACTAKVDRAWSIWCQIAFPPTFFCFIVNDKHFQCNLNLFSLNLQKLINFSEISTKIKIIRESAYMPPQVASWEIAVGNPPTKILKP